MRLLDLSLDFEVVMHKWYSEITNLVRIFKNSLSTGVICSLILKEMLNFIKCNSVQNSDILSRLGVVLT